MRIISILFVVFALVGFAACPDRSAPPVNPDESADSAEAAPAAPITEDNAIESADEILEEIDNL